MDDDRRKAIMDHIGKRQDHAMKRLGLHKMRVGGRQCGKRTLTIEAVREAADELLKNDVPQNFKAIFPASLADHCLREFGGRLVRCSRPGMEAYDEIVEHNEGQNLIILVEKP